MAKLGSYYGLCPLIDHKNLLGVSEDCVPGYVIVTLGKNMAIKYKLSDQKQIISWSTKEKLSSPVIYDKKEERYIAVFNQNYLKCWDERDKNLEKLHKIKFLILIHTVVQSEDEPIIIFKNGISMTLSSSLQVRKIISDQPVIDQPFVIENQTLLKLNEEYFIGMLVTSENNYFFLWTKLKTSINESNTSTLLKKIKLDRPNCILNGHVLMKKDGEPILLVLWSDGRLYSYSILSEKPEAFFCVIESLSRKQPVCLLALDENYLVMYGADANQEGASLQIFNIQFKLTQAKMQMKMFNSGSKLWRIGSSLLLTVGQNLAVVPFHLSTEQLASLVGSHKLTTMSEDDDLAIFTEVIAENWTEDGNIEQVELNGPFNKLSSFVKEGWSESAICEEVFPKLFDNGDTKTMLLYINYFKDIPEDIVAKLLTYSIKKIITMTKVHEITSNGISNKEYETLLDTILTIPYSDVLLLPKLRTGFQFNEVLVVLKYFCFMLGDKGHQLPSMNFLQSEIRIVEWSCMLLDAFYQQFLLSKDNQIIECLEYFKTLIDVYVVNLDECKNVEPIIIQVKNGRQSAKILNISNTYSIQKIKLF